MPSPTALGYILQPGAVGGSVGPNVDLLAILGPSSVTYGRQVASWGDPSTWAAIAAVLGVPPVGNEYGIVVRSLPAGHNTSLIVAQTSVTSTVTHVDSATPNAQRRKVLVQNVGLNSNCWIGPSGVTVGNGILLQPGNTPLPIELGPALPLYAICASGESTTVAVMELA